MNLTSLYNNINNTFSEQKKRNILYIQPKSLRLSANFFSHDSTGSFDDYVYLSG